LEWTLEITQFQPPCHGQGHLPLDRVAQVSQTFRITPIIIYRADKAEKQFYNCFCVDTY